MSDAPFSELPLADATWLTRLARTLTRGSASADDLVQDTWMTVLNSEPPEGGFGRPWLARVLRRLHLKSLRSGRRRAHRESAVARSEAIPSTEELVERAELQQTLARCLLELDEPFKSTLMLVVFEGLSTAEIAERDGVSASVVRYRIRKAREALKQRLTSIGEGGWSRWHAGLLPFARLPLPDEAGTAGVVELVSKSSSLGASSTAAPFAPAILLLMNKYLWVAAATALLTALGLRELVSNTPPAGSSAAIVDTVSSDAFSTGVEPSDASNDSGTRSAVASTAVPTTEGNVASAGTSRLMLRGSLRTPDGDVPSEATVLYVPLDRSPSLRAEDLDAAILDDHGHFELSLEAWVPGRLTAGAPGFGSVAVDPWGTAFDPETARGVEVGEIVLEPGASISGLVERNGAPPESGEVRATMASDQRLRPSRTQFEYELRSDGTLSWWQLTAPIDSEGRFEVTGLQPGQDYRLVAIPEEEAAREIRSIDPIGALVRAPAVGVVLDWGMRSVHFVVTCEGEPVPFPGVRATLGPYDPRRQESNVEQDGLIVPRYGDEQGRIHALLSATERQPLRFVTPGYRELDIEFDPATLAPDATVAIQLVRESDRAQLDVRFVGPTAFELAGMQMRLVSASHERGMEASRLVPIRDGMARFDSLPPGFLAAFYAIVPAEPQAGDPPGPLPFFHTDAADSEGVPLGYLSLDDRLQAGEIRELDLEVEIGGRLRVIAINEDPNLPAPQLEAIDDLGNRTPLSLEAGVADASPPILLSTGKYTVQQVGEHYARSEVDVEIREREIAEVRFYLQR